MKTLNSDLQKIEEFIQLNGKVLLEVGCGKGQLTVLLVDKAAAITAIDPDGSSIEAARKQVNGVDFQVGSGEKLAFADGSFDIVIFSYSLHHQDYIKALAEAKRVARQDGHIIVIEPACDGEFTLLVSVFEKDEPLRLERTWAYINSGMFNILGKNSYCVDHPYADEQALYDYFTTNFMAEPDDRAVEKMDAILRSKKSDRPIIIKDTVNILLLDGN
ncbi:MAG: class I SAM-dependent methyltransferase [Desulfobacteraceae bacterium]|jgi:ubiquinone/menaquinone biosynthesis C-methylase UbiE|nr:class I SAM-dependent methyltransferase [Desulfobacteraceae bacterium]